MRFEGVAQGGWAEIAFGASLTFLEVAGATSPP